MVGRPLKTSDVCHRPGLLGPKIASRVFDALWMGSGSH